MTRHNPLASSIGHPDRWELGQRLIYVSSGVTERCKSEMLTAIAGSNAVVVPILLVIGALQQPQQALTLNLPDHEYDELLIDAGRKCIQSAVERAFH